MSHNLTLQEQTYQYFLQEAPELLHALEQGLLSFQQDHGIHQINHLMRITHTLKGAATSVGLETIATVAHSLEDIFKALCNPDAAIDAEAEALLFEGVECLRLPLVAQLNGGAVNHEEILDRAAAVFAQLQYKLGDCFGQAAPLPTAADLGFDVVQSIFEVGVVQRLDQLAAAVATGSAPEVAAVLRTQADVFLGLAESLNLQGFGSIAQAAAAALDQHPDQTIQIAEVALADFRAGQAAVLAGDRTQGGLPSPALQAWAGMNATASALVTRDAVGWEERSPESNLAAAADSAELLLENIWGGEAVLVADEAHEEPIESIAVLASTQPQRTVQPIAPPTPVRRREPTTSPQVRVNVKQIEELNYSVGELLTNHNRQLLQAEQAHSTVQMLLARLSQYQSRLNELRDAVQPPLRAAARPKQRAKSRSSRASLASAAAPIASQARLVQSLLDDWVQLSETADAIDLFTQQSLQTLETQRQLLTQTRAALIEARMLPLGDILNRLPPVLQQLESLYGKPVELSLRGADVLVDKVVAEKLYDPLLHLVRNAFDHGIEAAAVRQQQDKPRVGRIEIRAHNQGRYLVLEIQDDGRGLDFEQILQRAIERQRLTAKQAIGLNHAQLIELLFEPGFSTAAQISDLSGRGIGLDVVRNQVQALRGTVTVQSEIGQGTTFVLKIPLNLTIAPLVVCEAGGRRYALLDDAIEQIVLPQSSQIEVRNQRQVMRWGKGETATLVPLYALTELLNYAAPTVTPASTAAATQPVILLRAQETLLGLAVDQMVGEQELVIRPLGGIIDTPDYVHGASILADRRLALVIDGAVLLQKVFESPLRRSRVDDPTPMQLLPPATLLPTAPPALPSSDRGRAKILVVEDSITTRHALALTLQNAGYQVLQAPNGHEALAQLHHAEVQLVLCDVEMPIMNGFEFLRQIQHTPALAELPVLMLTSRSDESYRSLALQLGAAAYLTKPYMEHKLLTMVATLLSTMQTASQAGAQ